MFLNSYFQLGTNFCKDLNDDNAVTTYIRCLNTGEKVHQCAFCPYSTKYKSNIQSHLNIHVGKKPFKCPKCGKGFSHKSNSKRHFLICGMN